MTWRRDQVVGVGERAVLWYIVKVGCAAEGGISCPSLDAPPLWEAWTCAVTPVGIG